MEGKGREGKERRGSEANGSSSKNNINRNHCTPAADIYIYYIYTILRGAKRAKRVQHLNFGAAAISNKLRQRQAKGRGGNKRGRHIESADCATPPLLPPSGSHETIMKDNQLCLIVVATAAAAVAVAVEVCRVIDDGCGRA